MLTDWSRVALGSRNRVRIDENWTVGGRRRPIRWGEGRAWVLVVFSSVGQLEIVKDGQGRPLGLGARRIVIHGDCERRSERDTHPTDTRVVGI